jgi:hypothetical protein
MDPNPNPLGQYKIGFGDYILNSDQDSKIKDPQKFNGVQVYKGVLGTIRGLWAKSHGKAQDVKINNKTYCVRLASFSRYLARNPQPPKSPQFSAAIEQMKKQLLLPATKKLIRDINESLSKSSPSFYKDARDFATKFTKEVTTVSEQLSADPNNIDMEQLSTLHRNLVVIKDFLTKTVTAWPSDYFGGEFMATGIDSHTIGVNTGINLRGGLDNLNGITKRNSEKIETLEKEQSALPPETRESLVKAMHSLQTFATSVSDGTFFTSENISLLDLNKVFKLTIETQGLINHFLDRLRALSGGATIDINDQSIIDNFLKHFEEPQPDVQKFTLEKLNNIILDLQPLHKTRSK